MCGILAILDQAAISQATLKILVRWIDARGPDYSSEFIELCTNSGVKLALKSSVLHLRGLQLQKQPLSDCDGNILLFNGQIYQFDGRSLDKIQSDTQFLSDQLSSLTTGRDIAVCLSKITGPFALIFWHEKLNTLFYGRDLFGRKSLCELLGTKGYPSLLSSVCCQPEERPVTWTEVNCSGIHSLEFGASHTPKPKLYMREIGGIYHKTIKCQSPLAPNKVEMINLGIPLATLSQDTKCWSDFNNRDHEKALQHFETILLDSVTRRLDYNKPDCIICRKESVHEKECCHSKVAIAFSGGIDSTILALAIDKSLEEKDTIDLVNVAFKQNAPDRTSVQEAIIELIEVCPSRNWRLILCDVDKEELQKERDSIIKYLIQPCDTVVDDSLGCACWFVGRAKGRAIDSCKVLQDERPSIYTDFCRYNPPSETRRFIEGVEYDYKSPASMMFAGTGIDEQLGGYSSHRAAWTSSGIKGIIDEVSFQMRRISSRNLGRDDRVYSYHGRDMKLPFLDESLVSFLNQLPIGLKMNLNETLDIGPKLILRELAVKWGLQITSRRVKRALQFGTKIANLENSKEKGSDKCSRLVSNV